MEKRGCRKSIVWRIDRGHHDVRDTSVARVQSADAMIGHWPHRRPHPNLQVELVGDGSLMGRWKSICWCQFVELVEQGSEGSLPKAAKSPPFSCARQLL